MASVCEASLSVDERYRRVLGSELAERRAVTFLIRDALAPVLFGVGDFVAHLSRARLLADIERARRELPDLPTRILDRELDFIPALPRRGYDAAYAGQHGDQMFAKVGFTHFNSASVRRLLAAVRVLERYTTELEDTLSGIDAFAGAALLLSERTSGGTSLRKTFLVANDSVVLAASQLTSDRREGRDAGTLLRQVGRDDPGTVSLMVKFALALAPGLLGPHGSTLYVRDPLEDSDVGIGFSPRLHHFLKEARSGFKPRSPFEFGFGCPVAHRAPGARRSALQAYLNAVFRIYDLM